jgi:hypothetical protein
LIKSLQKASSEAATTPIESSTPTAAATVASSLTSFKPAAEAAEMVPNNQSGLSTATSAKPRPPDNYKNNILKAKSQDENKKVGGNAMFAYLPQSTEEKSRYATKLFVLKIWE